MVNETAGAHQEAIEFAVLVEGLNTIIQTTDNIMTTRSLTTAEDDAYIDWFEGRLFASLESNNRHAISIGEHSLDFVLITYALSCSAFHCYNRTLQGLGELRLVGSTSLLKCTFLHIFLVYKLFIRLFTFRMQRYK